MIKLTSILKESMFPKEFDRHSLGSCMDAASYAGDYLYKKGIRNFKIVEGWVSLYSTQDASDWSKHTWIEFDNGRIFDPTRKQWTVWGFDPDKVKIKKIKGKYTFNQYKQLCF